MPVASDESCYYSLRVLSKSIRLKIAQPGDSDTMLWLGTLQTARWLNYWLGTKPCWFSEIYIANWSVCMWSLLPSNIPCYIQINNNYTFSHLMLSLLYPWDISKYWGLSCDVLDTRRGPDCCQGVHFWWNLFIIFSWLNQEVKLHQILRFTLRHTWQVIIQLNSSRA